MSSGTTASSASKVRARSAALLAVGRIRVQNAASRRGVTTGASKITAASRSPHAVHASERGGPLSNV